MVDRVPEHPGRVRLIPVPGEDNLYDLVREDGATVEGTPLCKATMLPDDVCNTLGLNTKTAEPKDAFTILGQRAKTEIARFSTSGYWTCPAGFRQIDVFMVGGGQGGKNGDIDGNTPLGYGGGGGFAYFIRKIAVSPGTRYSITVGAGGASNLGVGGDTSAFGHTAKGGTSQYDDNHSEMYSAVNPMDGILYGCVGGIGGYVNASKGSYSYGHDGTGGGPGNNSSAFGGKGGQSSPNASYGTSGGAGGIGGGGGGGGSGSQNPAAGGNGGTGGGGGGGGGYCWTGSRGISGAGGKGGNGLVIIYG